MERCIGNKKLANLYLFCDEEKMLLFDVCIRKGPIFYPELGDYTFQKMSDMLDLF